MNFCALKDTFKRLKSQVIAWEKIFENHVFIKNLCPEYLKAISKLSKKTT